MKALAIDSAASCMTIAAKNEDLKATLVLDLGQKQSQTILPSIISVLDKAGLKPSELDYTALCEGPGTFTGLRLAFSALKALELSCNAPVYALPTLKVYSEPFADFDCKIIPVIDAKKDQFFAAIYKDGKEVLSAEDTTPEKICSFLEDGETIIVSGPDSLTFGDKLSELNKTLKVRKITVQPLPTDTMFVLAEKMIDEKKEPLSDYSGPVYLRKSEAELALSKGK